MSDAARPILSAGALAGAVLLATPGAAASDVDGAKEDDGARPRSDDVFRQVFGTDRPVLPSGLYPVRLDGREIGEAAISPGRADTWRVDRRGLIELLEGVARPALLASLRASDLSSPVGPIELEERGVDARFDRSDLALVLNLPANLRAVNDISVSPARSEPGAPVTHDPEPFAAALNLYATGRATYGGGGSEAGLGLLMDGFANWNGWVIDTALRFSTYSSDGIARDDITLTRDDEARAIRYTALEFVPERTGFQAAPTLLGIGMARDFSIRPYELARPVASRTVQIDRTSEVEVYVNGAFVRRLTLGPGEYDFRDFPLYSERSNDIELRIEDRFGQVETLAFDAFFDFEQLAVGLSEFSFNLGAPVIREDGGRDYRFEDVMATGFYRRGLTESFTAGVNFQTDFDAVLAGADAVWASPIGSVLVSGAASGGSGKDAGWAVEGEYRRLFAPETLRGQFEARVRYVSEAFSPVRQNRVIEIPETLTPPPPTDFTDPDLPRVPQSVDLNPVSFSATASWRQRIWARTDWAISANYRKARDADGEDSFAATTTFSRRIGPATAGVTVRWQQFEETDDETSLQLRLSVPIGARSGVNASLDTRNQSAQARYFRTGGGAVGSNSLSAAVSRSGETEQLTARAGHVGNRYRATARQDVFEGFDGEVSGTSEVTVSTALVHAGGRTAASRPVRDGFAIISTPETMPDADLLIEPTPTFEGDQAGYRARTDRFGPAVLPGLTSYFQRDIEITPRNVPAGTSLDAAAVTVRPDLKSGYAITVGDEANVAVLAHLVDPNGDPVARASGRIRPLDEPDAAGQVVFTNATGRLYAEDLEAGRRYRLEMADRPGESLVLSVPGDALGLVRPDAVLRLEPET